jgi:putative phosphoesterase
MLVGVVSDTHDNIWAARGAARLFLREGAELVIHLGDIVAPFTLRVFAEEGVRRLVAVYGNNCGERIGLLRAAEAAGYEIGDWPRELELAGRRLLLLHGVGPAEQTRTLVEALASTGRWDAVLYGHTHQADIRRLGGTLVLNPGEACGCLTGRRTAALLDTETMEARLVEIPKEA